MTDTTQKTVRMSREAWDKWNTALLSGEFQQAERTLCEIRQDGSKGYCCLGVMEVVLAGDAESRYRGENGQPTAYESLPSDDWLARHNVGFRQSTLSGGVKDGPSPNWVGQNPIVYISDADWDSTFAQYENDNNDFNEAGWHPVARLNDSGVPFPLIAKLLANHVEFTD